MRPFRLPVLVLTCWLGTLSVFGQTPVTDPVSKADSAHYEQKPGFFHHRWVKASIVPAALIGYGLTTIKGNGLYSSYQAQADIQKHYKGFHNTADDIMIWLPYAELSALYIFKVDSHNDFLNTGLLILKSQALMAATVFGIKEVSNQWRPNSSDNHSFPSGHTAQAFLAASIVHKEFKHKSPWYGVGAYTIAGSVAAFRMLNNKHWQSDVLVGAGVGMMSAHVVYLTHRHRWGRKNLSFTPTYLHGSPGFAMVLRL